MPRLPKQSILYEDKLEIPEKYLRFSTPEVVAIYRANKLCLSDFVNTKIFPNGREGRNSERNQKIKLVEIGAGIGGQTFAFAKICKEILTIESDKKSANFLIQNLKKLNIQNVKVLVADALSKSTVEEIKNFKPDVIFCDTERPEKAERTLENIKPSINKILETFSKITSKIAIEIPPFTKIENFNYEFEKEFISINQQLNRLTLYFNKLKQNDISAVALPSEEKIVSDKNYKNISTKSSRYVYVIDPTIILANLVNELAEKFNSQIAELNKPVLLSDKIIKSDFLTGFEILTVCKNDEKEILQNLKKFDAGKVILRYNISPENYWKIRNFYEKQLNGNKEISIFIDDKNNKAILSKKLNLSSLIKLSH